MYLIGLTNKGRQIQLRSFQIVLSFFVSVQDTTARLGIVQSLVSAINR